MNSNIIRILLIEDNFADIRLLKEYLNEIHLVETKLSVENTLESAIDRLKVENFGVILLDLNLSDSNGLETFKKISKIIIDIPIIILSGLNDQEFTLKVMKMGAQDYLTKDNLEPDLLIRTIRYSIERKNGEMALKKVQEELRNARDDLANKVFEKTRDLYKQTRRIETILETVPDGILVLDSEGKIILANQTFRDMYKKITKTEISDTFSINFISNSSEIENTPVTNFYMKILELYSSNENKLTEFLPFEPTNGFHIQLLSKKIISQENKEFLGVVLQFRDVSVFVEFENIRKQFVSTLSHELRTPITAINLGINNMKKYWKNLSEDQLTTLLISVERGAKNLSEIVEDMLILSSIEENKVILNIENIVLFDLIFEIISQLGPNFDNKKIKYNIQINKLIKIDVDRRRIGQVFRILIDNAIKYSPENSTIEVSHYKELNHKFGENGYIVQVKDEGIGIKREEWENIFSRFYRGSNVRDISGSGLGLSIAQELTHLHKGKIFVESELGKGSTFSVFLPFY
jgi:two-component system phosphate regulon sensor histidine kinase PhoR